MFSNSISRNVFPESESTSPQSLWEVLIQGKPKKLRECKRERERGAGKKERKTEGSSKIKWESHVRK